jgi:hypothetical protein
MTGVVGIGPVGLRLACEVCAEESLIALPAVTTRYHLVDCPCCLSSYLVQFGNDGRPEAPPAAGDSA